MVLNTVTGTLEIFQGQIERNLPGAQAGKQDIDALCEAIKGAPKWISSLTKRTLIWMIRDASNNLLNPIEVTFNYDEWGTSLTREMQLGAAGLMKLKPEWIACGVGRHLSHHCGGRDSSGKFKAGFPASTFWIIEGEDMWNHEDKCIRIPPNIVTIGNIEL